MGLEVVTFQTQVLSGSDGSVYDAALMHVELTSCDGQTGPTFSFSPGIPNCVRCRAAHESSADIAVTRYGWPLGSDMEMTFYISAQSNEINTGTVIFRNPGPNYVGEYTCLATSYSGESASVVFEIQWCLESVKIIYNDDVVPTEIFTGVSRYWVSCSIRG